MNWEALAAIGSLGSAIVIAVTVIFAAHQVRLTRHQLEQLRRSSQLGGAMAIFDKMTDPAFLESENFVRHELAERLKDETFVNERLSGYRAEVRREEPVLRLFEQLGTYVKNGLLDGEIFYDAMAPWIESTWKALRPVIEIHRRRFAFSWDNFEYLYVQNHRWMIAGGALEADAPFIPLDPRYDR